MKELIQAAGEGPFGIRNHALVTLMLATGLRVGELVRLELDDIDWEESVLRVRAETSKSRRIRCLPLGPKAAQAVRSYIDEERGPTSSNRLFVDLKGRPLCYQCVETILRRLGRQIGARKLTPHVLRHTFATQALLNNMSLPMVQHCLGHTNLSTTSIYLNQSAIQAAAIKQQLTPVDFL